MAHWVAAIWVGVLMGLLVSMAFAWPERSDTTTGSQSELCPGFLVMDPDTDHVASYEFVVILPGQEPRRWIFASSARCRDAWAPLAEALDKLGAGRVTPCH